MACTTIEQFVQYEIHLVFVLLVAMSMNLSPQTQSWYQYCCVYHWYKYDVSTSDVGGNDQYNKSIQSKKSLDWKNVDTQCYHMWILWFVMHVWMIVRRLLGLSSPTASAISSALRSVSFIVSAFRRFSPECNNGRISLGIVLLIPNRRRSRIWHGMSYLVDHWECVALV